MQFTMHSRFCCPGYSTRTCFFVLACLSRCLLLIANYCTCSDDSTLIRSIRVQYEDAYSYTGDVGFDTECLDVVTVRVVSIHPTVLGAVLMGIVSEGVGCKRYPIIQYVVCI